MSEINDGDSATEQRSVIARHTYIGGSSAATILGKNEYQTRESLWRRKVERTDLDLSDNLHVLRGNLCEPMVEEWIKKNLDPTMNNEENWRKHDHGLAQRRYEERKADAQIMLMDTEQLSSRTGLPYIGGHPDGVGDEILWEIKVPTSYKLSRIMNAGIPDAWRYQVQHYMMISGLKQGCVAVWSFDKWEPYLVWIDADPFIHAVMREEYERFWDWVERKEMPPEEAASKMEREQLITDTDPKVEAVIAEYYTQYRARYDAKDAQDAARIQLLSLVGERSTIITPEYTCSVKRGTRYGKPSTTLTVKPRDE